MPPEVLNGPLSGFLLDNAVPLSSVPIHEDQPVHDHYEMDLRPFARGKFAQVKRCRHRQTGQEYAAKIIRRRRRSQDISHEILHEIRVLLLARPCDRIVGLHEVFVSSQEYVLILELVEGGELQKLLDEEEFVAENRAARIVRQVLEGLQFLHQHQIAHLDIKPQNILMKPAPTSNTDKDTTEESSPRSQRSIDLDLDTCDIKLCDFGISRHISSKADLREIVGTPDYVSPEILHYDPISLATDMWSVGCLTYVLLTGYSPFGADDKQTTFLNITQAKVEYPDSLFAEISRDAIDFINQLLVKEPKKRLSCVDALAHAWLASTDQTTSTTSTVDVIVTDHAVIEGDQEIPVTEKQLCAEQIQLDNLAHHCSIVSSMSQTVTTVIDEDRHGDPWQP